MSQLDFGGATYDPDLDKKRLETQLDRVWSFLLSRRGQWVTLAEIHAFAGGSESGCSARLRDLRKSEHGLHTIERQRLTKGTYSYRLADVS